jgi:SAM-dependent methyltransferase
MRLIRWMTGNNAANNAAAMSATSALPTSQVGFDERARLTDMPYVLPKDKLEEERIAFQHKFLKGIFNLSNVPFPEEANILDVGSGAGMWSRDMAHDFPKAQVYAIDLEEPKITGHLEPGNYHYIRANILKTFPFADNSFDYTYQRLLVAAIPTTMWSFLFLEELRVLKNGGWLEALEVSDVCVNAGPIMTQFLDWGRTACARNGIYLAAVKDINMTLKNVGLKNITSKEVNVPIGEWGGPNGKKFAIDMLHIFGALKDVYRQNAGVSADKFDYFLHMLPQEWEQCQTSYVYYHVYGQKLA